jgi:DNA repair photolyase
MPDKSPNSKIIPSRGTKQHVANKYLSLNYLSISTDEFSDFIPDLQETAKTKYIEVSAKSMINKVNSPDLHLEYSLNPYQGCEHGCIYCYARPTHNYWGYSAGDEFETRILIKTNALAILKKELSKKTYQVKPLMLSGNTDCYQPIEKKYKLTRSILELCLAWKHPIQLITKNALILRDLDLYIELNKNSLCSIAISITASNDKTRRIMEPRASTISSRFKTVQALSQRNIPCHIMIAPVIPGINNTEIFDILKESKSCGAKSASYQLVRLNGDLQDLFSTFLDEQFPDGKNKILNAIKSCHNGKLNDSRFGLRMKGEGNMAHIIQQQFKLAYSKYFPIPLKTELNTSLFRPSNSDQLSFW